jgi:positive regulator of sigma E activity
MKEKGLVLSKEQDKTRIRISNPELCLHCHVRFFCIGKKSLDNTILVHNPLGAEPGDEVEFEIPQTEYNKQMIKIFGLLLFGIIGGVIIGYIISSLLTISKEITTIFAILLGLVISGFFIIRNSKKEYNLLFPTITRIIKKGENNG